MIGQNNASRSFENMNELKIKEILCRYSDDIPMPTYKDLVTAISEISTNPSQFCIDCGITVPKDTSIFNLDADLSKNALDTEINIIEKTKCLWNSKADNFNQWHELDLDEKLKLISEQQPLNISKLKKSLIDSNIDIDNPTTTDVALTIINLFTKEL